MKSPKNIGCSKGAEIFRWLCRRVQSDKEALIFRLSRNIVPNGECMEWVGAMESNSGYPRISVRREDDYTKTTTYYVHHIFWALINKRPIPEGTQVDHTCCNRRCVKHLQIVTPEENLRLRDARRNNAG